MYCGTHLKNTNTASLAGREWDILSQGESENDINVAIEWDVIPDTPTWMRNNRDIIRGVIRLGRTNLQSLPLNALQSISSPILRLLTFWSNTAGILNATLKVLKILAIQVFQLFH